MAKKKKNSKLRSQEDGIWKEAMNQYTESFFAFFFPMVHQDIDWSKGYDSLDKELAQITAESKLDQHRVDKLLKVFLADGTETWLLLHIEVQGYSDADFAQRVCTYNFLISNYYKREAVSLAILSDNDKDYRPNAYSRGRWGFGSGCQFPVVKLLDYNHHWEQLEQNPNPFAFVVMAHLKSQELNRKKEQLKDWEMRLVKLLYQHDYGREDIIRIFQFIDGLIRLPPVLALSLREELDKYNEEVNMPYISSVERIAKEEGRREGRQEGRQEGMFTFAMTLLEQRFGLVEPIVQQQVEKLSASQLQELGKALLNFVSQDELTAWLQANFKS